MAYIPPRRGRSPRTTTGTTSSRTLLLLLRWLLLLHMRRSRARTRARPSILVNRCSGRRRDSAGGGAGPDVGAEIVRLWLLREAAAGCRVASAGPVDVADGALIGPRAVVAAWLGGGSAMTLWVSAGGHWRVLARWRALM